MICISLADLLYQECLEAVRTLEFAEIRLDLLDVTLEQIAAIFAANRNLIATCRPGKYSDSQRKAKLLQAIASGAAYVDIEMESDDALKKDVIHAARQCGCQVIISYHDFEKTPTRQELEHIVNWCSDGQPDLIKIACMVNAERDNARLLGLLDSDKRMIVIGMGEKGKVTRIVAPLLGSFCTFAPYVSGKATAPGQVSKERIEILTRQIQQL